MPMSSYMGEISGPDAQKLARIMSLLTEVNGAQYFAKAMPSLTCS